MSKLIIDANETRVFPSFREIIKYKDLFITLSWRDFKVRYAQTTIGFIWAFIQPLVTLAILSLVFNKFAGVETGPVPHLLFTITGLSLWSYFSYVLTNSGSSIIQNQGMIKKIYFPRLIVPLSKAVVGLIDMGIALLILVVCMIYFQIPPASTIVFAPLFILMTLLAALAVGIWLSALTVRYRDFQHIVPFMVQIGLYLTPIAYPISDAANNLPSWLMKIYYLNPMTGIVEGFRWSIFGGKVPDPYMYISFGTVIILLIGGLYYFKQVEDQMADYV